MTYNWLIILPKHNQLLDNQTHDSVCYVIVQIQFYAI